MFNYRIKILITVIKLFLIYSSSNCQLRQQKNILDSGLATITINMKAVGFPRLLLHYYTDFLETKQYPYSYYHLDSSTGNLTCKIFLKKPMLIKYFMKDVFVTPGDSVHLNYIVYDSVPTYHDTLIISGRHAGNYEYFKMFNSKEFSLITFPKYQKVNGKQFLLQFKKDLKKYVDNSMLKFKNNFEQNTSSDYRQFIQYEFQREGMFSFWLSTYKTDSAMLTKTAREYCKKEILKRIDFSSTNFKEFLLFIHRRFLLKREVQYTLKDFEVLQKDASSFPYPINDYLLTNDIIDFIKNGNRKNLRLIRTIRNFAGSIQDQEYFKKIQEYQLFNQSFNELFFTTDIASVQVVDPQGQLLYIKELLNKFQGQFIYLDLWASWCKPCRAEIPALKELIDRPENKGIAFVGISIDTDKNKWKQALTKDNMTQANNYCLNSASDFIKISKQFQFYGVPHYFFLDKDGTIFITDAPYPRTLAQTNGLVRYTQNDSINNRDFKNRLK